MALPWTALAQANADNRNIVDLSFGSDGHYVVWLAEPGKWEGPVDESRFTGQRGSFTVRKGDKRILKVADIGRNLLAARPASDFDANRTWTLKAADWTRFHETRVQPERSVDGLVNASCGGETRSQLIARQDRTISLWGLKRADVSLTIDVRVEGETKATDKVVFSLKDPRPVDEALAVRMPAEWGGDPVTGPEIQGGGFNFGQVELPPGAEQAAAQQSAAGPSIFSTILNLIIAVVLIGGVGYGVWMYFRKNPGQAKEMLAQAGIQDPGAAPADGPPAPPEPTQKPLERIILDGAAPAPSPALAAAPVAAANPRLVRPDGSLFLIPEGEATVGREGDHAWTLPDEFSVSRMHARLRREAGQVWISDAGSTNGVWVNGARIAAETPLQVGDAVMIGAVQARFEA
jgi:hypothetical protein